MISQLPQGQNPIIAHHLRPISNTSDFLKADYFRILDHTAVQQSPQQQPIALWICQESRIHTLKHFIPITHATLPGGSFYLDPKRDSLLLCWDFEVCQNALVEFYGRQLRMFDNVLVDGHFWTREDGAVYKDALAVLGPVKSRFLCEGFWHAWGRGMDRCGVRAAARFLNQLQRMYHDFEERLEGLEEEEGSDEEEEFDENEELES
ncbi:hypothetical protein BO71DRAFT_401650, partial [Aspergillus ellipticus CBS 707.79]